MRCILTSTTYPIHAVVPFWEYDVGDGSAYRHAMEGYTVLRGRVYYTHCDEILKDLHQTVGLGKDTL